MSRPNSTRVQKYDHLLKLLLIGDSGVGKSCLLLRYSEDSFTTSFITTIGIDFKIKSILLDDKKVKLQIWDTAGQERFRTITTAYYRGAMGIFLVYDVGDEASFRNVENWVKQIDQHAERPVVRILLGNKCDLDDSDREVTFEQGQELADQFDMAFFETSAKTNRNVNECFEQMARGIVTRLEENPNEFAGNGGNGENVSLGEGSGKGESKCC